MNENNRPSASDLEVAANDPGALRQIIANCQSELTKALDLIGAMQSVVSSAEAYINFHPSTAAAHKAHNTLTDAVMKYRAFESSNSQLPTPNAPHHHLSPGRQRDHALHRPD